MRALDRILLKKSVTANQRGMISLKPQVVRQDLLEDW